jgi:recombination protein RecA
VGVLYGNPETTSGGQALKFYASQRVDVRMKERIKGPSSSGGSEGAASVETGVRVKAKVVKNKVAPPYK